MNASEPAIPTSCPTPLPTGDCVTLAHGEGARLTRKLIRNVLLPALTNDFLAPLADGATLPPLEGPLVMTTDSTVVSPLFFPGGDIGKLAVHGAINDLSVCGATPLYLSLAFILEEGLDLEVLRKVVASIAEACRSCGVAVVTGDTKVVPRGAADKIFITTTGIGRRRPGVPLSAAHVQPGDQVLVSGTIGDHGLAILAERHQLGFDGLASDTAPIHDLCAALLNSGAKVRFLRDPTRGGVAGVLYEILEHTSAEIFVRAVDLPVSAASRGALEILGLDPWYIANEGKLLAIVAPEDTETALDALRSHPLGRQAARIGEVRAGTPLVVLENSLGAARILHEPAGAPLPRIC